MKNKQYLVYVKRWEKYIENEKKYWELRERMVKEDRSEAEFKKLDKEFGHDTINSGPLVIIDDPFDLINPNFILPGLDHSFSDSEGTDKKIPYYFGKRIRSEYTGEGTVIGYAYDCMDDYIQILTDTGETKYILVNSYYELCS